ncbi:MAG: 3-methyl-2-oxobutanoate hydroxymethyltransferase [Peptococcaceae bacterium]|nr:3-methyl-2-oxobutanoate hydroxymethyltransferase [Peptococcaceae bacterium]
MNKKTITFQGFQEMKNKGQKFTMITAYDYPTAVLVDQSPIEMILVGDSLGMTVLGYDSTLPVTMEDMIHHSKAVLRGAPNTFVAVDMPFGSYNESISQAISNGNRLMKETGADCLKLEGGVNLAPTVRAFVDAGIPVMGHIGLTPQTASLLGGFKVQGKDAESAKKLMEDAMAIQEAGAFSLVMECVPSPLAKLVSEKLTIPTIGIGAGPDCDGQVLVFQDLVGLYKKFTPKFVKQYLDLGSQIADAFEEYANEVKNGTFPSAEYSFDMNPDFLKNLK